MLRWSYFNEASTCVFTVVDSFIESYGFPCGAFISYIKCASWLLIVAEKIT